MDDDEFVKILGLMVMHITVCRDRTSKLMYPDIVGQ